MENTSSINRLTIIIDPISLWGIRTKTPGMTLYAYAKDSAGKSTCSAGCLANWLPLLATAAVTAGTGLDATLFATAQTSDGRAMVTYKGLPLYYYKGDKNPGDTNGNNIGGVWSVVKP